MANYVCHDWYGSVVLEECRRLRKSLQPISKNYHAASSEIQSSNTLFPFVLLLGNHSSGKSSFINYLLGQHVQATGVAPTDDNFTIIAPGEEDIDRNGPALVGDPDLGFHSLANFGSVLVNHTQLKVRANIAMKDFMLVDSPGMIDSPGMSINAKNVHDSGDESEVNLDRGYNFEGVVRWYAERADVILLFFDPEKPGTTGETLSILTTALTGLDHKLFIILNKADQFNRIHDFARAYGSLCWNLSKVIPRKDLPRIHTMCLPASALPKLEKTDNHANSSVAVRSFYEQGYADLEEARNEVIKETFNAPKRRVDNEISRLHETVQGLLLHCNVVDKVAEKYHSKLWRARLVTVGAGLLSIGVTVAVSYICDFFSENQGPAMVTTNVQQVLSIPPMVSVNPVDVSSMSADGVISAVVASASDANLQQVVSSVPATFAESSGGFWKALSDSLKSWYLNHTKQAFTVTTGLFGAVYTSGVFIFQSVKLQDIAERYASKSYLQEVVKDVVKIEKIGNEEVSLSASDAVFSSLSAALTADSIPDLERVHKNDFHALHRILKDDIAHLRRQASPAFPVLTATPQKTQSEHIPRLFDSPFNIRIAPTLATYPSDDEREEDKSTEATATIPASPKSLSVVSPSPKTNDKENAEESAPVSPSKEVVVREEEDDASSNQS